MSGDFLRGGSLGFNSRKEIDVKIPFTLSLEE